MASKAKYALVNAFLKILEREDFDKITVTSLVEECSISRQTFYYHFDDIEAMLQWAFENETAQFCKNLNTEKWYDSARGYVDFILKYKTLFLKAAHSKNFMMIYNYLYQSFYTFIECRLAKKQGRKAVENSDMKFYISYNATALCGMVLLELQKDESDFEALYQKVVSSFQHVEKN